MYCITYLLNYLNLKLCLGTFFAECILKSTHFTKQYNNRWYFPPSWALRMHAWCGRSPIVAGGYSDLVWTGGVRLTPQNPYPRLKVILAEKGTHI